MTLIRCQSVSPIYIHSNFLIPFVSLSKGYYSWEDQGWVWTDRGFLSALKVVDIAGCSAVHLVGGTSALVAAIMLKPRLGRYDNEENSFLSLGSPTNALVGMFMLW
ncbi:ammonium transporter 3 [Trichonephila inaurata madagascariensis]|uniref:Ammonium transporter 3 n=3 Tax=Trichonephila inaurata madagascariensis TaxID=2747483 RepID=A0A8X6IEU0_9ARAC|nr:ammonium transporter 3 [Trichonephila inaurata madagascariensis]